MKISHTILALLAAGLVGQSAFGSDNNGGNSSPLTLGMLPDGHGGTHIVYFQNNAVPQDSTSVALYTNSGGVATDTVQSRERPLTSNGDTRFVLGTNQHGLANAAYIPTDSHFSQAGQ